MRTMAENSVIHSTFTIERSYPAAAEKVFAAFADPAKKRRWYVDGGNNQVEKYDSDFRSGGKEVARFKFAKPGTPVDGLVCVTDTNYLDMVQDRRLVMSSTMTIGGHCISAALITVELVPTQRGTDLILTHQAAFFEGADGPEMREQGWRSLMDRLGKELER